MSARELSKRWIIITVLAGATLLTYWRVKDLGFISEYDDNAYVTENLRVQSGLTWDNLGWAITTMDYTGNWHPLTWISHMLDCQLFGLNPMGHHLTSLIIHLANVILLFLVLQVMTGAVWRSAGVAALFALHPINVESVAWIAERKNVLSTFFLILTVWAYYRYATQGGWRPYLVVCAFFSIGLMVKPMLVTLPFALLLLDYWPLGRLRSVQTSKVEPASTSGVLPLKRLLLEKVPLVLLAAGSSVLTYIAQEHLGSVAAIETLPITTRVENAVVSYGGYLKNTVWPTRLAVLYPLFAHIPARNVVLAASVLACITGLVLYEARRRKYLVTGWFWYLGTLVPVLGLIQVGKQSMADRYAYVPLIGVFIVIVWGVGDLLGPLQGHRSWLAAIGLTAIASSVLIALCILTVRQLGYWRSSQTVFEHAVAVTQNNYVVRDLLAEVLAKQGQLDRAVDEYTKIIAARPSFEEPEENLGMVLVQQGKTEEAIRHFKRALEINSGSVDACNRLGAALADLGRFDEAIPYFYRVLEKRPNYSSAYANLGSVFEQQGKLSQAVDFYGKALSAIGKSNQTADPMAMAALAAQINYRIGNIGMREGKAAEAADHYREALRLAPGFSPAKRGLDAAVDALRKGPGDGQ
ncbi:MAG TPA: tetratricopeptide repeat protein [Blastocatellia bacterium]|nr:tetratricopeptide repeat protein [Blastocatellia bacterium]